MKARYLDRNDGTEIPSNLMFVSVSSRECKQIDGRAVTLIELERWCGLHVRLDGTKTHSSRITCGETTGEFWKWFDSCLSAKKKTWVYIYGAGHSLTLLDFWNQVDDGRYTFSPMLSTRPDRQGNRRVTWQGKMCIESSPFFISARQGKTTFNIVDVMNYYRATLDEIAAMFGMTRVNLADGKLDASGKIAACQMDAEIICRAMCSTMLDWKENDCGVWQTTAASLSLTSFKHMSTRLSPNGKKLDIICEPNARQHKLERQAYYGGKVTCYQYGEVYGELYHLDVNSLYPKVMRDGTFPRCYEYKRYGVPVDELHAACGPYGIVAEVLIESRNEAFPVRIEGRQFYCTGNYWTVLCGQELRRALHSQCVLRSGNVQYYSCASYFAEWVNYWYSRKSGQDGAVGDRGAVRQLSKIILNSLYGKFAQSGKRWVERHGCIPLLRWGGFADVDESTGRPINARGVAGVLQHFVDEGEPRHSFPAISAFITAAAREFMLSAINIAGESNVYYSAVDSLICNHEGFDRLNEAGMIDEKMLGKFKIVGTHKRLQVFGHNDYILDGERTCAGIAGARFDLLRRGLSPEILEGVQSLISKKPDAKIAKVPISGEENLHSRDGWVDRENRWHPFRLSNDPDFTDRPPRHGYQPSGSSDREQGRILLSASL